MNEKWSWWLEAQRNPEKYYMVLQGNSRTFSVLDKVVDDNETADSLRVIDSVKIRASRLEYFPAGDLDVVAREWHLVIVTISGPWLLMEYCPENYEKTLYKGA